MLVSNPVYILLGKLYYSQTTLVIVGFSEVWLYFSLRPVNESQHSILSDEDIDYWDKTEEDLDTPCGTRRRSKRNMKKRPSAPPEEDLDDTPPKRLKNMRTEVSMTACYRAADKVCIFMPPNKIWGII